MIKKLFALAAGTLLSLNASAAYVQYNFNLNGAGSGLSGFIVQHEEDGSIAFFSLQLNDTYRHYGQQLYPFNNDGAVLITGESSNFGNSGPTNFSISDNFGSDHQTYFNVHFWRSTGGNFGYTANYNANLYANIPSVNYSGTVMGIATKGAVDQVLVNELDMYGGYDPRVPPITPAYVGPTNVPEPASLALLAVGALGAAGAIRRRRP